jgi:hypothetical protein
MQFCGVLTGDSPVIHGGGLIEGVWRREGGGVSESE